MSDFLFQASLLLEESIVVGPESQVFFSLLLVFLEEKVFVVMVAHYFFGRAMLHELHLSHRVSQLRLNDCVVTFSSKLRALMASWYSRLT